MRIDDDRDEGHEDDGRQDDGDEGDELEAEIMRADRPFATDERETTPEGALEGLSIDEALARERPEGSTVREAMGLVDDGAPDTEGELVAEGSLEQDDFASPEESAVSVRDDAPGATDHDDPHPPEEA